MTTTSHVNRTFSLTAVALSAALLAGCTPELPVPGAPPVEIETPVLTEVQGADIAAATGEVLTVADEAKEPEDLDTRVTGPALKIRKAEYKIAKSQDDDKAITELPSTLQSMFLTTTSTWPRTMFAVSDRPQNLEPERLLVYTQDSARDDYKLWAYLTLFPGTTVPMFPSSDAGTTLVTDREEGLQVTPTEALENYAALLKAGTKANKEKFDLEKDTFYTAIAERRTYLKEAAEQIEGSYTETFKVGEDWKALRTLDGGALVVGTIETSGTLKGEDGAVVTPSALEKAFLKKDAEAKNELTVKRSAVVAVYIPAKDNTDEQPRNIGRLMRTTGASIPD
ncbi:hypothetical protein ACFSYH_03935 [Populibacterium corticicola]|uniref:DUF8094 domain-containing protein n=1 Tax=Populibacterium corticicola TaxID=1812826 RepID=A0ABW5XCY5_9MICO